MTDTSFPSTAVTPRKVFCPEGRLITLPTDCVLLGLKGAEDGNDFVARYLGEDQSHEIQHVTTCNLLEDAEGA